MHLVINDQSPGAGVEQAEMDKFAVLAGAVGEHLIGRHVHRAGILALPAVFGDGVRRQVGLVQQLPPPLFH